MWYCRWNLGSKVKYKRGKDDLFVIEVGFKFGGILEVDLIVYLDVEILLVKVFEMFVFEDRVEIVFVVK